MEQRNKLNDTVRGNQPNSEYGTFYRKIDPVFSKDQRHKKDGVEALKLKGELRDIANMISKSCLNFDLNKPTVKHQFWNNWANLNMD